MDHRRLSTTFRKAIVILMTAYFYYAVFKDNYEPKATYDTCFLTSGELLKTYPGSKAKTWLMGWP